MRLLEYESVRTAVNDRLGEFLAGKREQPGSQHREVLLHEIERLVLRPGAGKRLRPYLACLAYAGFEGNDASAILDVAIALELIHQGLLIHDDIIDRDALRYGGPNITGVYQARFGQLDQMEATHFAEGAALLAGNLLLDYATELVVACDFPVEARVRTLRRKSDAIEQVLDGELSDMIAPLEGEPTEASVLHIARAKTAGYSCVLPLQVGAELAGASKAEIARMGEVGEAAGVAFQIVDDLLGMYGDPATTGKPATGDLAEGKHTLLMAYGLQLATAEQQARLRKELGNRHGGDEGHRAVQEILIACGAKEQAERMAETYIEKAQEWLEASAMSDSAKLALQKLLSSLAKRSK